MIVDMGGCQLCSSGSKLVSDGIGVCINCIRKEPDDALSIVERRRSSSRLAYGLPPRPPRDGGIACKICQNCCSIPDGGVGFCGLRKNVNGRLVSLSTPSRGLLHYYLDPHVTNCCAAWFCPAGTGAGYPRYAVRDGPEHGYYNLAIFFYGCNFDCAFCQNWSHKQIDESNLVRAGELVDATLKNDRITCWCFFGGSPEPQLPFAINASKMVLESVGGKRVMRICLEWNGCGNHQLVKKCGELSFISGGNIKFDLKAFDPNLSVALSGVRNDAAYRNFSMLFQEFYRERREVPVLNATTLLVPGYIDEVEVEGIARFIAEHDENIPYSLLIFHPEYMMRDLPITPVSHVRRCVTAARKHLRNVNVGNVHLLAFAPP